MDKYVNICITTDMNFVAIIVVLMTSIMKNMSRDAKVRFFIFGHGFTQIETALLARFRGQYPCEMVIVPMEQYMHLFRNIDTTKSNLWYLNIAAYFRLLMLKILPDDVEKCFYVDGDMIVGTDLSELFHAMPSDKLAAVCPEVSVMQDWKNGLAEHIKWPEFAPFTRDRYSAPYFNSGFFLLNVKMAREMNLFDAAFEFLDRHPNPPYVDQDVLNAIIGQVHTDKLIYLGPEWNLFCDTPADWRWDDAWHPWDKIRTAFAHPLIYHYAGPNKPWKNRRCRNHWDVWWHYCEMSPCRAMRRPPIDG